MKGMTRTITNLEPLLDLLYEHVSVCCEAVYCQNSLVRSAHPATHATSAKSIQTEFVS